jgi:dTDP-4-dehydrorhamnose reductase
MRILITGGRGQLGNDCQAVLKVCGEVHAVDLPECDLTREADVRLVLGRTAPEVVVNCAAFTNVDACETQRETARQVNGDVPGFLARACVASGARLIQISTDYVFDGAKPVPQAYVETDPTGPVSWYGQTKLEGERAVQASGAHHAILRTAWLYGRTGRNFLKAILRKAVHQPDEPLRVVNDQFGSPTWSFRLALQIRRVIETQAGGLFHATAEGYTSWYEFARFFLDEMAVPHRVEPCLAAEYPRPARRPRNSILENAGLKAGAIHAMVDWREDVKEFVRQFRDDLLREAAT